MHKIHRWANHFHTRYSRLPPLNCRGRKDSALAAEEPGSFAGVLRPNCQTCRMDFGREPIVAAIEACHPFGRHTVAVVPSCLSAFHRIACRQITTEARRSGSVLEVVRSQRRRTAADTSFIVASRASSAIGRWGSGRTSASLKFIKC